jgi:hypothetical protein
MRNPAVEVALLILGVLMAILALQLLVLVVASRPEVRRRLGEMGLRSRVTGHRTYGSFRKRPQAIHPSVDQLPSISDSPDDRQALVKACEAFVAGTYVESVHALDPQAPLAWLNHLAHADATRLEALAGESWQGKRPAAGATWHDAASFLAQELIGHAGNADELQALQRSILVPLELWILSHRAAMPGPDALSRLIITRLEAHERHGT